MSQLRVQGLVPVIVYGARTEPIALQIPYRPLEIALKHAGGTHVITINFEGKDQSVITREVQRDILRGTIMHVDFLAVDASTRITTEVAIHLVGASPIVETRLGLLVNSIATLSVEALPADLVDMIEVDISGLKEIGDAIHVGDLKVSPGLTILNDPDEMIVRIMPLRAVVEETRRGRCSRRCRAGSHRQGKIEEEEDDNFSPGKQKSPTEISGAFYLA